MTIRSLLASILPVLVFLPAAGLLSEQTYANGVPYAGSFNIVCYNNVCSSGTWDSSYYTDPRYQSQNWLMNSSLMHSRRYGYTPAIQQFVNKMHEQLRAPEYTVDRAFLEKQKEVIASLERFYAESAKFRSHLDPLPVPSSLNQSDIDQDMDPLWRAAGWDPNPSPPVDGRTRLFSDPLKTASEVQNLFSKIANYEKYQDKDRADYLRHELKRMFVNEDGILKSSQYASWPSNLVLGTKFTSTDGLRIRNGINTVMASQSVIGSYCGQSKLDTEAAEACNNFNSFAADLKLGHVLADRLANRGQTESFERLMNTLDAGAKFIQGIASAASDSISSLHEMGKSLAAFGALTVLGYPAAMKMAGNYLYNLASTISTLVLDRGIREKLVADRISESWKTVLHGDAKERGRLTGEIAILMAGFFVDPTRIAGLDSKLIIHAAEITATVKAVDRAIEIDIAAGKLGAQTGRAISEVTREAPYFGKSILPFARDVEEGIGSFGAISEDSKISFIRSFVQSDPSSLTKSKEIVHNINKSKSAKTAFIQSPSGRPAFYVNAAGKAIPATAYRHFGSESLDFVKNIIVKNRSIPEHPGAGNYITFNKYDDAAVARNALQIKHDARYRITIDTLNNINDLHIPHGNWGNADWLEPITKDMPQFGSGGASQAVTNNALSNILEVKDLFTNEILFRK